MRSHGDGEVTLCRGLHHQREQRSLRFSTFVEARANPDVGMQNHSSDGLIPQEREGCIPVVKVGAKRGTGIDSLLENIVLVAELQGLKANPDREAKGTVVNASLDNARGPLATLPVQNGTLLKEDFVLCGEAHVKMAFEKPCHGRAARRCRGGGANW